MIVPNVLSFEFIAVSVITGDAENNPCALPITFAEWDAVPQVKLAPAPVVAESEYASVGLMVGRLPLHMLVATTSTLGAGFTVTVIMAKLPMHPWVDIGITL